MKKTAKPLGDKYLDNPTIIGEHLRNRRLELRLFQWEVAGQIGVTEECMSYWETGEAFPDVHYIPKLIQFLGFCPILIDTSTLGGQIYAYRLHNGKSYAGLGRLLGVDATTIAGWEKEEHRPLGMRLKRLQQLLKVK